jgi:hypothetical protein
MYIDPSTSFSPFTKMSSLIGMWFNRKLSLLDQGSMSLSRRVLYFKFSRNTFTIATVPCRFKDNSRLGLKSVSLFYSIKLVSNTPFLKIPFSSTRQRNFIFVGSPITLYCYNASWSASMACSLVSAWTTNFEIIGS